MERGLIKSQAFQRELKHWSGTSWAERNQRERYRTMRKIGSCLDGSSSKSILSAPGLLLLSSEALRKDTVIRLSLLQAASCQKNKGSPCAILSHLQS